MKKINVVSACFEAMLDQKFHIYAGGLGVVQSGLLKSAGRGDWPVNLYGWGILWKQGYYDQKINLHDPDKHYMRVERKARYYDFLEDTGVKVKVEIKGHINIIKVWRVKPETFNTVAFYLADTDLEENDVLARSITQHLYGGNEETRLAQEIVLGIGGVRAFEALGIPIDLFHGQEGHTLLAAIELLRNNLMAGMTEQEALNATKQKFVFTTHTPELAGNETHSINLMTEMGCFPGITKELVYKIGEDPFVKDRFNMTVAALRLARKANAVSKLHLRTTQHMWAWIKEGERCPIISITNGVDADWQLPEFAKALTLEDLRSAKERHKEKLIKHNEKRTKKVFSMDIPIIVWARRHTAYKRPDLIFTDWLRLKKMLQDGLIQLLIAGKPHPSDIPAINYYNWLYEKSLEVPNLSVWAGYEREQSAILKAGADIWLFTSRRPREACHTSGMSAMLSGTIPLASRDGWYDEIPEKYYFPFGVDSPCVGEGEQDSKDYRNLMLVLGNALKIYNNDKPAWYQKALLAKQYAEKNCVSDRMLKEYIDLMYLS